MAQPGLQRMRTLGDISRQIELESEMSKTGAREAFARGRTQSEEQRRAEEGQARTGLLSGLAQAGGQAYRGYQLGKLAPEHPELSTLLQSGVDVPYYALRGLLGDEKGLPSFEEMLEMTKDLSEEESKRTWSLWMLSGGGE